MDGYCKDFRLINFDIINHECRGTPLQNPQAYYKSIKSRDFKNYEPHVQNNAVSSAIKSECDDIHFEHDALKQHFKEKTVAENALVSNSFFLKEKKHTTDFTKLKFQFFLKNKY